MTAYRTEDIRNVALIGQSGSGKTSLVEKLLFHAGIIAHPGSVEKGTTICDYGPEEKHYQHSLNTAVASIDFNGIHINLLDTPGYPDFIGQALSATPAADTLAIVINAQNGIEAMTRRLMAWASVHQYCRMIVINKVDGNEPKLEQLLKDIQTAFGRECIPINLPAKAGNSVVDCLNNESVTTLFSSASDIHTSLIDQIVEMDDELMEHYLDQGTITPEQLHVAFEKALREGHLIPVCFVSAANNTGVPELLKIISTLAPNPLEGTEHKFLHNDCDNADERWFLPKPLSDQHVMGHVFKISFDPFVGKMGIFRIHQGKITKDTQLFVDDQKKAFKVGHLFRIQGKEFHETDCGLPGDICAVAKVDQLHFNAIIHDSHEEDDLQSPPLDLPEPITGVALDAKTRSDEHKLALALEKITTEDPCLVLERNTKTHETILKGLGEFHLRVAMEKLAENYHIDTDIHTPKIDYRESITCAAEGHHRHKKQSGGAGQFGEVYLRIEPLERGEGFEFNNAIVGGTIPGQFVPAVEKGVRQAMEEGALAAYTVQDVKVTVYDGKHHAVDSNEISFVTAARKAFVDAFMKAKPIILEPLVKVEVLVPQEKMGDISGDLAARRGRIIDTLSANGGRIYITAHAPLAELNKYASKLKSLTGGEGEFTMMPLMYETVPADIQNKLIKSAAG